jgi:toxin ParE1/3/4
VASYVLSEKADADLTSIYEYTLEKWGLEQLQIYQKHINQALELICQEPLSARSKARDDLTSGCRLFHVQHHYIAYRVQENTIQIGRILHERMHFDTQVNQSAF